MNSILKKVIICLLLCFSIAYSQKSNNEFPFLRPDLNKIGNPQSLKVKLQKTFSDSSTSKIFKIFVIGDSYTASGEFVHCLEEELAAEFGDGGKIKLSLKSEFPTLLPYNPLPMKKKSSLLRGFELYSIADSGSIEVMDASSQKIPFAINPIYKGRAIKVTFSSPVESFYINNRQNVPQKSTKGILAFSEKGVVSTFFGKISASIRTYNTELNYLYPFIETVNPDLIIIYLGTNDCAGPNFNKNYFDVEYGNLLKRLKKGAPAASYLLISPPTFYSYGKEGFKPNKNIKILKEGITSLSLKEGLSYWDLSEVMGGDTIMPVWVKSKLAVQDYIHLTKEGHETAAKFLAKAIIDLYKED